MAELAEVERMFIRACVHFTVHSYRMSELCHRYERAKATNRRIFQYKLRLDINFFQEIEEIYYNNAIFLAKELIGLNLLLFMALMTSANLWTRAEMEAFLMSIGTQPSQ
jgi:hypothetical protein